MRLPHRGAADHPVFRGTLSSPSMTSISRSVLVPYTAEEMYALVSDIERYPEFLPWCKSG